MKKGRLILKDGHRFDGYIFGAEKSTAGEVVFSTGMVGYPESLTDPSFQGQLLTFTYPLIGNYGVPAEKQSKNKISTAFESSRIHAKGIIVSEYSENYSHWDASKSLSLWLKQQNVTGITGLDTRELTQILREKGCMLGKIIVEDKNVEEYDPNSYNIIPEVSPVKPHVYKAGPKRIIMIDCGVKNNTIRHFLDRNITIIRVPWDYDFFAAKEKFDGVFISNGPGDPSKCTDTINLLKKCFKKKIPTFGICLGNQLMGLAAGAKTYKLKYGHRAQNQPCIDMETGRCYMTSQNHGFAIDGKTLPKEWKVWYEHANDHTVEGIKHLKMPFFSVQFHPEAAPGPTDTESLFDQFVKLL
jgi:carbamoyl-phosphate synthase small subunit